MGRQNGAVFGMDSVAGAASVTHSGTLPSEVVTPKWLEPLQRTCDDLLALSMAEVAHSHSGVLSWSYP